MPTKSSSTILNSRHLSFTSPVRRSRLSKFFLFLCLAFLLYIIYMNVQRVNERQSQEPIDVVTENSSFTKRYKNKELFTSELKHILLWTPEDISPFYYLGKGQEGFIKNKCEFTNCFVTPDKNYLGGDITKFDAIAFNGVNMPCLNVSDLPQKRSPYQKFIFFGLESSTSTPVCNPWFDDFFNWTSTYKLNSDCVYSYIYIRNSEGEHIGPRIDMEWITDMKEVNEGFKKKLQRKKKAAAWFVSHCVTRSSRENYVKALQKALKVYNLTIDVYGDCGTFHCPRTNETCNSKVDSDYYFYLSFENALAEDYVTEKLLIALNNNAVPIVYGGSNYSRFLPPGSYLNARKHHPEELAALMSRLISNPSLYHQFFRWRNHYSYTESEPVEDVCNVCAALNDWTMMQTQSVYVDFRSWWNHDWQECCRNDKWIGTRLL